MTTMTAEKESVAAEPIRELIWHTGPGTPLWKRIAAECMQNTGDPYNCAIVVPGRANTRAAAEVDPAWKNARLAVRYDGESGVIAVTMGGLRYERPLTHDEIVNIVQPFDKGTPHLCKRTKIVLNLDEMEAHPAQVGRDGTAEKVHAGASHKAGKPKVNKIYTRRQATADITRDLRGL